MPCGSGHCKQGKRAGRAFFAPAFLAALFGRLVAFVGRWTLYPAYGTSVVENGGKQLPPSAGKTSSCFRTLGQAALPNLPKASPGICFASTSAGKELILSRSETKCSRGMGARLVTAAYEPTLTSIFLVSVFVPIGFFPPPYASGQCSLSFLGRCRIPDNHQPLKGDRRKRLFASEFRLTKMSASVRNDGRDSAHRGKVTRSPTKRMRQSGTLLKQA
ncbi:hypothetical protein B0T20DRAFT_390368 [Sordaria brevicollis]|uniref:Uncharacterized protein n=1 Tax=Sordaria brevicollis TaxID=83679 RepID=A0AAE0UDS4_SORBR|nr:hypothetical protein B0T20DRAFT_390368 [Sordaria brevicollis]